MCIWKIDVINKLLKQRYYLNLNIFQCFVNLIQINIKFSTAKSCQKKTKSHHCNNAKYIYIVTVYKNASFDHLFLKFTQHNLIRRIQK